MQLLSRLVAILDVVSAQPDGLGLADIAKETELAPATSHRLLAALQEEHLVERDPETKKFRPGVTLLRLAGALGRAGFDSAADRGLRALRDRWQESFFVAALQDDIVFSVRSVATNDIHRMSASVPVGRRMNVNASASGKVIAAFASENERERLLAHPEALREFTPFTITDRAALEREFDGCRERGFAVCDQETEIGVAALAVPVLDPEGGAVTRSVAVIGPRERILQARDTGLLDDMRSAALFLGAVSSRNTADAPGVAAPA